MYFNDTKFFCYRHRLVWWLVTLITLYSSSSSSYCQNLTAEDTAMHKFTDQQVIDALAAEPLGGATDETEADVAVREIMRRGERMIPVLLNCRGDNRLFWGGLGRPNAGAWNSSGMFENKDENDGSAYTVEVAAIYLISALYRGTFDFAGRAYLRDGKSVSGRKHNTSDKVARAWTSTEKWARRLEQEGMEALRTRKVDPLTGSGLWFDGDLSLREKAHFADSNAPIGCAGNHPL